MGWTWKLGTPKERADMVRSTMPHLFWNEQKACELFNLNPMGLADILEGHDWAPEHAADHKFSER